MPDLSCSRFQPSSCLFFLKSLFDSFLVVTAWLIQFSRDRLCQEERDDRKQFTNNSWHEIGVMEVRHEGVDNVLGWRHLCFVRNLHRDGCGCGSRREVGYEERKRRPGMNLSTSLLD